MDAIPHGRHLTIVNMELGGSFTWFGNSLFLYSYYEPRSLRFAFLCPISLDVALAMTVSFVFIARNCLLINNIIS